MRRRAACQLLKNIYDIFAQHERWFPDDVQGQLATASRAFMKAYLQLSAEAVRAEKKLWKATPKFHAFDHIFQDQACTHGNPRYFWTYGDEDLQRIMNKNALACHPSNLAPCVLYKWLVAMFDDE